MLSLLLALCPLLSTPAEAARVKELGYLFGTDPAHLQGVGLVVGLNGTGDSPRNVGATQQLVKELQSMGVAIGLEDLQSKNVALVVVQAEMPIDARPNTNLDVRISALGDAKSLTNGSLMDTKLYTSNHEAGVFAIASGALSTGSVSAATGQGDSSVKNHPTVATSPGAAQVVQAHPLAQDYFETEQVEFILNDPDFTTMQRMTDTVNGHFGPGVAWPRDSRSLVLQIPESHQDNFVLFMAEFEQLEVGVDSVARVVINERTGTVVVGGDVHIQPVAIAHGNLLIEIEAETQVAEGPEITVGEAPTPVVVTNSTISVSEEGGELSVVSGGTIEDLVDALNAMGMKPRDLVSILQAIDAAGALEGELVIQ